MDPVDLAHERRRRARAAHRKLARCIREAALHATPAELADLHQVALNVQAGHMPVHTAQQLLTDLLRQQNQRRNAA
jgi:hypothetical protein